MRKDIRHNAKANCKYCGREFGFYSCPSVPTREFCSATCRNKGRIKNRIGICPICGKEFKIVSFGKEHGYKKTCSQSCGSKLMYLGKTKDEIRQMMHMALGGKKTVWNDEKDNFLKTFYPNMGAKWCSIELGLNISAVRNQANRLGAKLTKEATRRIVNDAARKYMTQNNPMKRPEVVKKVNDSMAKSGKAAIRKKAFLRGKQLLMREKPSKTQLKMMDILREITNDFIHEFEVKSGFFVDFAMPEINLIIQVDGCYWHGHKCRFQNLTDRQTSQKKRDAAQDKYLTSCGWKVVRVWECDINKRRNAILKNISRLIARRRKKKRLDETSGYNQLGMSLG